MAANSVAVGYYATAADERRAWQNDISVLRAEVDRLREQVDFQNELLRQLWFAPGMPGALLGKESFNKEALNLLNNE